VTHRVPTNQRRFAAGEIDEDEYWRRRALLHDRV